MSEKHYIITVKRTINATPQAIWETWKDPEAYVSIHGSHHAEIDFRGGKNQVTF